VQLEQCANRKHWDNLHQKNTDDFGLVMLITRRCFRPSAASLDGMVEQLPIVTELAPEIEETVESSSRAITSHGTDQPAMRKPEYEQEKERFEFMKSQVEICEKPKWI